MKMIVGLGNPGPEYRMTRHNVGFRVADRLAERWDAEFTREKYRSLVAEAVCDGERVLLIKPLTFMNRSGEAVSRALRYTSVDRRDMLVVVDDVNLGLGGVRLRAEGSAGGHNGLKSIIAALGSEDFPRLRIGVGRDRAGESLVDHVLSGFASREQPEVEAMLARGAEAAERFVTHGIERAMNDFNG